MKVKNFLKAIGKAFKEVDWENVPKGTWVRYIMSAIAILNAILGSIGIDQLNITENTVYLIVTVVLSVFVIVMNTYKDNPTSKEGILAASIRNTLKEMDDLEEEGVINDILALLEKKDRLENTLDATEEEQEESDEDDSDPDSEDPTDESEE